ncbi:MAG: DUF2249 domain-containing protein [Opitutae bacterium]|nr:DUF2249 domain-containing protein [Opitutae bacterium]
MSRPAPKLRTLDVRPLLARGEEPFATITATVDALAPGEGFAVIAPFLPAPLIEAMRHAGFSARPERQHDGAWKVFFSRD